MQRRAVVLEVDGRRAVVLTETGEIRRIRVPWPGLRVGQEVVVDEPRAGAWRVLGGAVAAAAAAAAWLLLPGRPVAPAPVAVVSLDVNPSLSLALAADGRVTAITGWDADGRTLAAALAPECGRRLTDVAAELARTGRARGFLGPSAWVLVAGAPEPGQHPASATVLAAETAVARQVERLGRVPPDHVVTLPPASAAAVARAASASLSLGRYLAAERVGLSLHQARRTSVQTLTESLRHTAHPARPASVSTAGRESEGEPPPPQPAATAGRPEGTPETGDHGGRAATPEASPSPVREAHPAEHGRRDQATTRGGDHGGSDHGGQASDTSGTSEGSGANATGDGSSGEGD
ncbi:MAG: anti-sigma factor domain-containing protein [Actinomycetia bacterium]|nr:anti-sigma factor domain-containing protein [Actinomycetes bacterium]